MFTRGLLAIRLKVTWKREQPSAPPLYTMTPKLPGTAPRGISAAPMLRERGLQPNLQ